MKHRRFRCIFQDPAEGERGQRGEHEDEHKEPALAFQTPGHPWRLRQKAHARCQAPSVPSQSRRLYEIPLRAMGKDSHPRNATVVTLRYGAFTIHHPPRVRNNSDVTRGFDLAKLGE
jgi:hypothetical protein